MNENLKFFFVGNSQQDSLVQLQPADPVFPVMMQEDSAGIKVSDSLASDSLSVVDTISHTYSPSILHKHQLTSRNIAPEAVPHGNEDWITIHFLIGLMVFAWVRLFYSKRLKQMFRSLYGIRFQGMMSRDGNILRERISIALMVVYLISMSLLGYLVFTRILALNLFGFQSFRLFSFIMLLVILSWILKNLANSIIGGVFKNPVIISDYILTNFVFNITLGLILFPILILAVYLPSVEIIYFGLGIWAIAFVYRLIRLLVTSLSYIKFSLFNRILYLCTFELMPVFIIIKLVMSNLSQ